MIPLPLFLAMEFIEVFVLMRGVFLGSMRVLKVLLICHFQPWEIRYSYHMI